MPKRSHVKEYIQMVRSLDESIDGAYLLQGDEIYLQDNFINAVSRAFEQKFQKDWEKYTYHATEVSAETILNELLSESLFAKPRIVIIKNVDYLERSGQEALLGYLENPDSETCVIMTCSSIQGKRSTLRSMQSLTTTVDVHIPWVYEMTDWSEYLLGQFDLRASAEVRQQLVEMAGESLQQLANELQKLKTYLPRDDDLLTQELLKEFVGETRTHSIFEFKEVLGNKEMNRVFGYVFSLLEEGVSVSYILRTIADFYMELWLVKEMVEANQNDKTINREVFQGKNLTWKYKKFATRFSRKEIQQGLPILEEADLVTKTTSVIDEKNYMTAFLYELLTPPEEVVHD